MKRGIGGGEEILLLLHVFAAGLPLLSLIVLEGGVICVSLTTTTTARTDGIRLAPSKSPFPIPRTIIIPSLRAKISFQLIRTDRKLQFKALPPPFRSPHPPPPYVRTSDARMTLGKKIRGLVGSPFLMESPRRRSRDAPDSRPDGRRLESQARLLPRLSRFFLLLLSGVVRPTN